MNENKQIFEDLSTSNYNKIKDHLIINTVNVENNLDELKNIPYKVVGDIAITYEILLQSDENRCLAAKVTNEMLMEYGVDLDTLHNDALKSSQRLFPPLVKTIEEMLGLEPDSCEVKVYVITNEYRTNGAGSIFYPELLSKLSAKAGQDLYIIPSSIDECLAVYDMKEKTPEEVEQMIRNTNLTDLVGDRKLSDSLYHYDAKENILERNDDYEKRTNKEEVISEKYDEYEITDGFEYLS